MSEQTKDIGALGLLHIVFVIGDAVGVWYLGRIFLTLMKVLVSISSIPGSITVGLVCAALLFGILDLIYIGTTINLRRFLESVKGVLKWK